MIILASASPRRQELLRQIDCAFKVEVSNVDELQGEDLEAEAMVRVNSRNKALAVAQRYPDIPVLGADTVVSFNNNIYGKPKDREDAIRMLQELSGNTHFVTTGLSLCWQGKIWQAEETTEVVFAPLSTAEILQYVDTGEPADKAGAYGIQGRAAVFIEKIKGSYSNVVGLPLHCLYGLARKAGINIYDYGEGFTRG